MTKNLCQESDIYRWLGITTWRQCHLLFEIFYHCRCASVVGRNHDYVISVVCTTYVVIVDFRSFFNNKFWKNPQNTIFHLLLTPEKTDGIMTAPPPKKVRITPMMAWCGNPRLAIFRFFSMLNYEKWSIEYDFPFTFDHQKKYLAFKIICKSRGMDSLTMPPVL